MAATAVGSMPQSSALEMRASGWVQEAGRPDSWTPPPDLNGRSLPTSELFAPDSWTPPDLHGGGESLDEAVTSPSSKQANRAEQAAAGAAAPSGGAEDESSAEVRELVAMITSSSKHSNSKRLPLRARARAAAAVPAPKISDRPAWDSTPHRNRPRVLKGQGSITNEPWKRSEDLNYGRDAHIEWSRTHFNLVNSGAVGLNFFSEIESEAINKSESMGNRLLQQQKRKEAARQRAREAAIRAEQKAEAEAREVAREAKRVEVEELLAREAKAEDIALKAEMERQRLQAEAEAAAAAAAAEAARLAEEERLRAEAEASKIEAESAAKKAAKDEEVRIKEEDARRKAAIAATAKARQDARNTTPVKKKNPNAKKGKEAASKGKEATSKEGSRAPPERPGKTK